MKDLVKVGLGSGLAIGLGFGLGVGLGFGSGVGVEVGVGVGVGVGVVGVLGLGLGLDIRLQDPAKSSCRVKLCRRVVFSAYTRKPQPSARVYLVRGRARARARDRARRQCTCSWSVEYALKYSRGAGAGAGAGAGGLRLGMRCLERGLRQVRSDSIHAAAVEGPPRLAAPRVRPHRRRSVGERHRGLLTKERPSRADLCGRQGWCGRPARTPLPVGRGWRPPYA